MHRVIKHPVILAFARMYSFVISQYRNVAGSGLYDPAYSLIPGPDSKSNFEKGGTGSTTFADHSDQISFKNINIDVVIGLEEIRFSVVWIA